MTDNLIERMARGIYDAMFAWDEEMPGFDEAKAEELDGYDHAVSAARAALAAIREPSDGMMEAACVYAKDEAAGYAGACYTAMIDAALEGE
ncbi:MAG: hypothetical protein NTX56_04380 [Proteobacteria bacterium]|nr:hypothetical protein [Pseudomonadota bacterium]